MAHSNYYRMLFNKKKNKDKKLFDRANDDGKSDSMGRTLSKKMAYKLTGRADEKKQAFYEESPKM